MKYPLFTTTNSDTAAHLVAVCDRRVDITFSEKRNRIVFSIDGDARLEDDLEHFRTGRAMAPSPRILEVNAGLLRKAREIRAARAGKAAGGGA